MHAQSVDYPEWMTAAQTAKYISMSYAWLAHARRGLFDGPPFSYVATNSPRYHRPTVDAWLHARMTTQTPRRPRRARGKLRKRAKSSR